MSGSQRQDSTGPTFCGRVVADRYRVFAALGEGPIGRVYAATQLALERGVALKILRGDQGADVKHAARFARAARAASAIGSPHAVRVFDWGREERGHLYFAMELLEGETLARRLERGPLRSVRDATIVGGAVARALWAAHEGGVVHGDLKPSNVFLRSDGTVKVLDFGITAALVGDGEPPITGARRILRAPAYVSPERARGSEVGAGADLYALGVLLYEMIVGEPPFVRADAAATVQAHLTATAPRLGAAALWLHVPYELEALVASLLDKDPAARPPAAEVAALLERIGDRTSLEITARETAPVLENETDTILDTPSPHWDEASWETGARVIPPGWRPPYASDEDDTRRRAQTAADATVLVPKATVTERRARGPGWSMARTTAVAALAGALVFVLVLLARLAY